MTDVLRAVLMAAACGTLAAALGIAALWDATRRLIPNGCVGAVALSGVMALAAHALGGEPVGALVAEALAGVAAVLAVMLSAALVSARAHGEPGVGGGDVKLLAAIGVWVGPVWGLAVIAGSCAISVVGWACATAWRSFVGTEENGFPSGKGHAARGIPLAPGILVMALAAVLLKML